MASILRNVTNIQQASVLVIAKRFRGKINIQKPRAPHYDKARLIKLTEPYFPSNKNLPLTELCTKLKPKKYKEDENVENPFQRILARECLNWFNHSRLIISFHANPMTGHEKFNATIAFRRIGMHLKTYGKKTLGMALEGTKYEPFTKNYVSQNLLLFCPEPKIKQILKISKKTPQLVLLCAIYEGKYISKDELVKYSEIPDIQTAQAQLVQTLQNVGGRLTQHLTQQQGMLLNRIQSRIEQLKESDK